jgi:hypothetical protein
VMSAGERNLCTRQKQGGGGTYLVMSAGERNLCTRQNEEGRDVPGDVRRGKKPMHPSKKGGGGTYLVMSPVGKNKEGRDVPVDVRWGKNKEGAYLQLM